MRVLHVDHSDEFGGAELSLFRLLNATPPWEPVLLLPRSSGDGSGVFDPLAAGGLRLVRAGRPSEVGAASIRGLLEMFRFAVTTVSQACAVRAVVRAQRPDFVWANSSRSALIAALGVIFSRQALVVHLRDRIDRRSLGSVGFLLMTRFVLPVANAVVANSQSTLLSASAHVRKSARCAVIQSAAGIERVSHTSNVALSQAEAGQRGVKIGMVARIDPWKGQQLVIEAFAAAMSCTGHPMSLHLAGAPDFGHEEHYEALVRQVDALGIADQVIFEGRVEDVQGFLDRMDICVQYSTRPEPLGQNVLQYLARGKAVIVADEGGPIEWVQDRRNGLVVEPRSPIALAHALIELVDDEVLRNGLATAARQTPGLLSDYEVAVASFEFLRSCLPRKRGARR